MIFRLVRKRRLCVAAVGAALVSCATNRMAVPSDVSVSSDVLDVRDRSRASGALVDESFGLGPYAVTDVDRDWDSSSGFGAGPWSKETKTTGFAFKLKGRDVSLTGKCASETREQGILGIGGEFSWGSTTLACHCDGDGERADLVVSKDESRLSLEGDTYELVPVHAVEGGGDQGEPTGFRADSEELLGAVEVMHPGRVWLRKGLDVASASKAACLFTGLMLYEPPGD